MSNYSTLSPIEHQQSSSLTVNVHIDYFTFQYITTKIYISRTISAKKFVPTLLLFSLGLAICPPLQQYYFIYDRLKGGEEELAGRRKWFRQILLHRQMKLLSRLSSGLLQSPLVTIRGQEGGSPDSRSSRVQRQMSFFFVDTFVLFNKIS